MRITSSSSMRITSYSLHLEVRTLHKQRHSSGEEQTKRLKP
jgi:hypothetical protein